MKKTFQLEINGINHVVHYTPAESDSRMFGGIAIGVVLFGFQLIF
jgi:hypothetical protein